MIDDLREIFVHLSINKMRTSLTGLSVSVGIFLLIILLGAGNGLINAFDANMGSVALDAIKVWPGVTSEPYNGFETGREIKFDSRDPQLINRAFPERVHSVTAKNQQSGVKASYGNKMLSGTLNGCYPDNIEIDKIKVLYGRYLSQSDLDNQRKVIVISERSAEEFFTTAINALNKPLRIDSIVYHVVGIVSNKGIMGGFEGDIPYTSMQLLYRKGQNIEELILRTNGTDTEEADSVFRKDLYSVFSVPHNFSPKDESAVWIDNPANGARERDQAAHYLRVAMWVIGGLTLLSGIVGISNIMLITIKERTHEFGIRKALGAKPWPILRSVLIESVIITGFFGYCGLVLGVIGTEYLNYSLGKVTMMVGDQPIYTFMNPTIDLQIAFQALSVLIISGLIAGFVPASKAVKVKPIEALRANE